MALFTFSFFSERIIKDSSGLAHIWGCRAALPHLLPLLQLRKTPSSLDWDWSVSVVPRHRKQQLSVWTLAIRLRLSRKGTPRKVGEPCLWRLFANSFLFGGVQTRFKAVVKFLVVVFRIRSQLSILSKMLSVSICFSTNRNIAVWTFVTVCME